MLDPSVGCVPFAMLQSRNTRCACCRHMCEYHPIIGATLVLRTFLETSNMPSAHKTVFPPTSLAENIMPDTLGKMK